MFFNLTARCVRIVKLINIGAVSSKISFTGQACFYFSASGQTSPKNKKTNLLAGQNKTKLQMNANCLSVASHFSDGFSPIKVVLTASTYDSRKLSVALAPRGR